MFSLNDLIRSTKAIKGKLLLLKCFELQLTNCQTDKTKPKRIFMASRIMPKIEVESKEIYEIEDPDVEEINEETD